MCVLIEPRIHGLKLEPTVGFGTESFVYKDVVNCVLKGQTLLLQEP